MSASDLEKLISGSCLPMDGMLPGSASGSESDVSLVLSNLHDDEVIPWYFSREEVEKNSPSRRDGIDLNKETRLRKSYCTFLKDLGVRLKVPQIMIATAIVFCHRFFLRQSHAKNDRWTIATVCMFLAGKVEETPRALKDVIIVSYEIIHKKNLPAAQRKEVYEQQKDLVVSGEELVLCTLNFDLSVRHPYKHLVEAIKKYMAKEVKAKFPQVAWSFVNDCLRTSLCLQYQPHHIAAGVFFLAAEHLTIDLQSNGEGLCQEFDITPRQLEDIRGQMLELYEKKHVPASQGSIVESSCPGDVVHQPVSRDMLLTDSSDIEGVSSKIKSDGNESDKMNVSQHPDDHSVHDKSNPESEARDNQDDHTLRKLTNVETSDDVVKAKGEKAKDLMDESDLTEREVEDVGMPDEDDKTLQRSESFLKVEDSDNNTNTSVEHSEILNANHSGADGELMADVSLMNGDDLKEMVVEDGEILV